MEKSLNKTDFREVKINGVSTEKFINNRISTTKYNFHTFLPRFLFEQFRKYSNCYFLSIVIFQQIPDVSPTGRFTTLVPFVMILCVSAFKEIIEDLKRKKADDHINNSLVSMMRHGVWTISKWQKLEVGDVLKIKEDDYFPADLVLLSSSDPLGTCYIETANLDGETNLKIRKALKETSSWNSEGIFCGSKVTINCEHPNKFLYNFNGNIKIDQNQSLPLGPNQLLLRGSRLKNTKWIFGCIVYSGFNSKLMLNSLKVPLKRSTVDRVLNKQILMLFCVLMLLSWVSALGSYFNSTNLYQNHWYLALKESKFKYNFLYDILTFFILYNNLIPISLQVTMEMVKFIQAIFIGWDKDMFDEVSQIPAVARTSNLNEELGQIQYIFSDKTGTLTCNEMTLKFCSINSKIYYKDFQTDEDNFDIKNMQDLEEHTLSYQSDKTVEDFLTICALCHTVVTESTSFQNNINYQAASPDERALVLGAIKCGYVFSSRTDDTITLIVKNKKIVYEILEVIEFTSDRKRMSVVVRDQTNQIRLFIKGADNVILNKCKELEEEIVNEHLLIFSNLGLRTLCLAQATLSFSLYSDWHQKHKEATTFIKHRESKIDEISNMIEKDLSFVGITGIEDKLQDGVGDCLESLLKANIKVWVLTGDKTETAVNIGISCKLLDSQINKIFISELNFQNLLRRLEEADSMMNANLDSGHYSFFQRHSLFHRKNKHSQSPQQHYSLIIDGRSLALIEKETDKILFLKIALRCKVVICCRVSPVQKAEVVSLVKNKICAITLAIGDGANDVGMIQEAHVGVGISGKEGLQAVCASDYSIAQFRFLKKLLLVHGNWNYSRVTKLVLYCFYKNICFYFCEFWYAFLSAFSGQVIFERWTIAMYNVLFTALPPLAIGLFDRTEEPEVLLKDSSYYLPSQNSLLFNIKVFWMWCLNSVFISIICFWVPYFCLSHDNVFSDGSVSSYLFLGNVIYTVVVITVCWKAMIECNVWNVLVHSMVQGSILLWFLFLCVYCNLWPFIYFADEMSGVHYYLFTSTVFWIIIFVVPFAALFKDIFFKISESCHLHLKRDMIFQKKKSSLGSKKEKI